MKRTIVLSVMFCLVLISSPVFAFDVEIIPERGIVESGDFFDFQILVHNNNNLDIGFDFNVLGPHLTWINQPDDITVDAHGSKTSIVRMNPVGEYPGVYEYNVSVSTSNYLMEGVIKNFTLEVLNPVSIISMFISNTPNQLNIFPTLTTLKSHDGTITFNILDTKGNIVKTKTSSFSVNGEKRLTETIDTQYVLAGDYSIVASIDGTGVSYSKDFTIDPVVDVQKTTNIVDDAFGREITISVNNNGNVIEYNYQISEDSGAVTGFVIMPTDCYYADDTNTVCASSISRLDPGQTVSITYMIEYWPTYATWAGGLVVAIIVLVAGFSFATSPKIRKRHVSTKGSIHNIALEIKNPYSRKKLSNVIIRDWVSPLAKVVSGEIGSLKPIIRKTEAGTELIWKLGDFVGKEERVITYKLKSLVEGELKMPRAYLRYRDDTGKGSKVFSKGIIIS